MRKEKGREKERGVGGGPDADVSAITLVATEQQQALPLPFGYWLVTLTTTHVVRAAANETQVIPLDWWSVFKETALCTLCALFFFCFFYCFYRFNPTIAVLLFNKAS